MRTLLLAGILCTGTGLAEYSASLHVLSTTSLSAQKSKALIDEMIEAMGGAEALYALGDVSYVYHNARGASEERYIFDGEISWGLSKTSGGLTRVQFFDGESARVWIDGEETEEESEIKSAFFSRKTNYYWLLMMQKLADPGLVYTSGGKRTVDGIEYDIVDVTFNDGVGVAKDRYLLYINPYTHLVDQFLFNVTAVGRQDPILMKYTYDTFNNGVKLPVLRQSHAAENWEGALAPDGRWSVRWITDVRFGNGFTKENILK
jgi:hypothetical protein